MPMDPILITVQWIDGELSCNPDKQDVQGSELPRKVEWVAGRDVDDFVVFFDSGAPVDPKMVSPHEDITVQLHAKGKRGPADKRSIKYCVAATVNGELKSTDPELIVQPG
ncbi:MAG: hypothetical protein JSW46_02055 [Gemmatimonadota bacterium]|nr:MAG: hypothetical protein JSW46_02055 [Gemmatimonadota bacterium]